MAEYGSSLRHDEPWDRAAPTHLQEVLHRLALTATEMSRDLFTQLGDLHETSLTEEPLEAPCKIITVYDQKRRGAKELGQMLKRATERVHDIGG